MRPDQHDESSASNVGATHRGYSAKDPAVPFTYHTRRTPRARPFSASLTPPTHIKDSRARTTSDANVYREPDPRRSRSCLVSLPTHPHLEKCDCRSHVPLARPQADPPGDPRTARRRTRPAEAPRRRRGFGQSPKPNRPRRGIRQANRHATHAGRHAPLFRIPSKRKEN